MASPTEFLSLLRIRFFFIYYFCTVYLSPNSVGLSFEFDYGDNDYNRPQLPNSHFWSMHSSDSLTIEREVEAFAVISNLCQLVDLPT